MGVQRWHLILVASAFACADSRGSRERLLLSTNWVFGSYAISDSSAYNAALKRAIDSATASLRAKGHSPDAIKSVVDVMRRVDPNQFAGGFELIFKDDHTMSMSVRYLGMATATAGSWVIVGERLVMNVPGSRVDTSVIVTLTKSQLALSSHGTTMTFVAGR
jgi:hypothetical protein